ncbi:unnamed protein product [Nezara viridula]|uniref:Uncharacterized protein n=1 Tax=Nezara viridula TaxID=85310 RepID=A0A9P0EF56_NEZVI|nr:unnamed protein product [Nezara viridula]
MTLSTNHHFILSVSLQTFCEMLTRMSPCPRVPFMPLRRLSPFGRS